MVEYNLSALPSVVLSHWIAKLHTVFQGDKSLFKTADGSCKKSVVAIVKLKREVEENVNCSAYEYISCSYQQCYSLNAAN